MQRRTTKGGDGSHAPAPVSGGGKSATSGRHGPRRSASDKDHTKSSPAKLIVIVCAIFLASFAAMSYISPSTVAEAEKQALKAEQMVESEVSDFFGGGVHEKVLAPIPHEEQPRDLSISATDAMLQQSSSWVDGEKKLKQKLKKLAELQAQGKELGVPALTRYLGEDIPAWAGEGVDVAEWQKKVDAKYAEMAEEEKKWREKVAKFMEKK